MALGLWDKKKGVINIVDKQLKWPVKEKIILIGGKISQHNDKTNGRPILRTRQQEKQLKIIQVSLGMLSYISSIPKIYNNC